MKKRLIMIVALVIVLGCGIWQFATNDTLKKDKVKQNTSSESNDADDEKVASGGDANTTSTPVPTNTSTPVPTSTNTPTPTNTNTPTPTSTNTPTPKATNTPTPFPTKAPTKKPVKPTAVPTKKPIKPSPTPTKKPEQVDNFATYSNEVLQLVNAERKKVGVPAIKMAADVQQVAELRAKELTVLFDHTRPNGQDCFTAFEKLNWHYVGENIAMGQKTPKDVVTAWMNSEGHRKNILSPNFNYIGIGHVYDEKTKLHYWSQAFVGR